MNDFDVITGPSAILVPPPRVGDRPPAPPRPVAEPIPVLPVAPAPATAAPPPR